MKPTYIKTTISEFLINENIDSDNNINIFYHGSNIKFDALKTIPNTSGESKFLGDGIYITNSKEIAESYSNGGYLYKVSLTEPLNSLQFYNDIPLSKFKEISYKFSLSDDSDLNYISDLINDSIDENVLWWGKQLIAELERNELDIKEILIDLGYNAIEAPINKLNQFRDRLDSDRNICIIKDDIIKIIDDNEMKKLIA